ncbi:hypothetical protein BpHYR1_017571 [Brachionus plicatilis]|uniref:Uncharacterized protein n=1 Tax=Brachionus plicatilis TaxID=10195 RepID=A0A3M7SQ39_BRAPC|nr:hypothetical protein BpHYR1_017571 [Brachionus plicatilis]
MNQHQKYSCKRSLLNKCFNAFIQFYPESGITKKEFSDNANNGGYINFIFSDFSSIEVLKRKSDIIFDGVEFKFSNQVFWEYTESQLDLGFRISQLDLGFIAAGNSSSGGSISSNSRKRRVTRTILYKRRNAYCHELNKEICISDFIELLTNEHLEVPAEVSCSYDPEINEIQFNSTNKTFKLTNKQSIQENTELSTNDEITDPLQENNEPTSSDQVKKVVGHYFCTDDKLYFELKWKKHNGREFLDSAESASIVHCGELINDYLKKILKKLKIPEKSSCKGSLETADFDQFGSNEQERLLNKESNLNKTINKFLFFINL